MLRYWRLFFSTALLVATWASQPICSAMCHIGRFTLVSEVFISFIHTIHSMKEEIWFVWRALLWKHFDFNRLLFAFYLLLHYTFWSLFFAMLCERKVKRELITYFESIQVAYRNLSSTLYQRVCRFRRAVRFGEREAFGFFSVSLLQDSSRNIHFVQN